MCNSRSSTSRGWRTVSTMDIAKSRACVSAAFLACNSSLTVTSSSLVDCSSSLAVSSSSLRLCSSSLAESASSVVFWLSSLADWCSSMADRNLSLAAASCCLRAAIWRSRASPTGGVGGLGPGGIRHWFEENEDGLVLTGVQRHYFDIHTYGARVQFARQAFLARRLAA